MKCYIAVTDVELVARFAPFREGGGHPPLNVLISLPYVRNAQARAWELREQGEIGSLFLDAGTYTLNAGGSRPRWEHQFEEYLEYVTQFGSRFDLIAAYDVDFKDPEWNQSNYAQMLMSLAGTGLEEKIVPVVHDQADAAEEFQGYIESGARVIAIGSSPAPAPDQWGKINWLRQKHGVEIHLFGTLQNRVLREQMPESVDTARYAVGPKYGRMLFWDANRHQLVGLKILNPQEFTREHEAFIHRTFGWTRNDLLGDVTKQWLVGIDALCRLQQYLTDVWYPEHDVADFEIMD